VVTVSHHSPAHFGTSPAALSFLIMPELPWVKWFPSYWASESGLRKCDVATKGIWIELINTMFLDGTGEITGTLDELCSLCHARRLQMEAALIELKRFNIAEVNEQNRTNDEQNITYSIVCRRNLRTVEIKQLRVSAGRASGASRRTKLEQVSTSTSTSTSLGNGEYERKGGFQEPTIDEVKLLFAKSGGVPSDADVFFNFYASKGWLVGKSKMRSVAHAVAGWVSRGRQRESVKQPETMSDEEILRNSL